MKFNPINTAPKDRAILTDEGFVCHINRCDWGCPISREGWALCTSDGTPHSVEDEDGFVFVSPTVWMEIPLFY